MAVFNGFPATYQNYYPMVQPQVQPSVGQGQNTVVQPQNSVVQSGIIWVQGEAGAKSYLVAPNTTVQLWDSENQIIYLKSADASGMPSMKVIDYTIRGANSPVSDVPFNEDKFISKDEFNGLKSKIERLENEINKLKPHKREERNNG